jgi:transposase
MTKANRMQSNKISFKGQEIFIGIDIHLKHWNVCVVCGNVKMKAYQQPPSAVALKSYLNENYPDATYIAAYECGICGFQPYYMMKAVGIDCITFNPADMSKTDKERRRKCDSVDASTIASNLKDGRLDAIYVPSIESLKARSLVRLRYQVDKRQRACKNQIKTFLYAHGIVYPAEFLNNQSHWTRKFIKWLRDEASKQPAETTGYVLNNMIDYVEHSHQQLLKVGRAILTLMKSPQYNEQYNRLKTVPGIGAKTASSLLLELVDFKRFKNEDKLAAYIGLIPDTDSSGDYDKSTGVTKRKSRYLRYMLVEAAWRAISKDTALTQAYNKLTKHMQPCDAIIRIARKLITRINHVIKNNEDYKYYIV